MTIIACGAPYFQNENGGEAIATAGCTHSTGYNASVDFCFVITEDTALATRVILVRHGTSTFNVQRRVQGHCDESNLSEVGRQEAAQVGLALEGLTFSAAYSSPLQRARTTADIILSSLGSGDGLPPLTSTDLLKEINLAQWEGMSFDEVEQKFPALFEIWRDRPHELQMEQNTPDGPRTFFPVVDLYQQARQFWQMVLPRHAEETILVVAHSGINRALLCTAMGLDEHHYKSFYQNNCGINVINFPAAGLDPVAQLEAMNVITQLGQPLPTFREKAGGIRCLLVRHGETDWNRQKKFQGQIDVPLNDEGRSQSAKAAEFLKSVPIDRAVTSPMLRPKETAEIILHHHPAVTLELEPDLQEISHGLWEGKLEEEIAQLYPQELADWKRQPDQVQMPEGENLQQVWDRAIAAWNRILASTPVEPGKVTTVMVVAHDAINKAILCHLVHQPPAGFWLFKQGNGCVTVIDYAASDRAKPMIMSGNITSHLSGSVLDKTAAGAL